MNMNRDKVSGFTLVELLITLAIATILLTVGVPAFQSLVKDKRMDKTVQTLITDLEIAKSEAMTRNQSVIVCRHNGATATPTACDNSADWKDGWVIFVDTNADNKVDTDELLRVTAALGPGLELSYSSATITFNSRGFASGSAGTLELCDDRGYSDGMKLIVSSSGFVQAEHATQASDCTP